MKLGEKILSYRKKLGLSQEELGAKVGVSRQTVSKWEIGQTIPELEKMILLAKEFATTIDDLVKDETENELEENENQIKLDNTKKKKHLNLYNYILIIIITLIGILLGVILYRYLMINSFKNRFAVVGVENIDEQGPQFSINNYRITESIYKTEYGTYTEDNEITYYNLENKYKKLYGTYFEPDRVEYLDYDTREYYDIDCINKTYKKLNLNDLPVETNIQITDKENMIKTEILANFNLWNFKGRMEIATNFDYNIQVIGGSYHIDNYRYYEDFINTGVSRWGLSFGKCEYEDKVTSMNYGYDIDYGVVNENLVRLPDLTEYTEIQN